MAQRKIVITPDMLLAMCKEGKIAPPFYLVTIGAPPDAMLVSAGYDGRDFWLVIESPSLPATSDAGQPLEGAQLDIWLRRIDHGN
jgi:hypothetical protein